MAGGGGRGRGSRQGPASPVEITVARSGAPDGADPESRFYKVAFAGHPIYTTYAGSNADVAQWISDVQRTERHRLRGGLSIGGDGSIVVGAHITRGLAKSWSFISSSPRWVPFTKVGEEDRAVELLSLCAGGNHCLLLVLDQAGGPSCYDRRHFPRPLREFLADRDVFLVGLGARAAAKTLKGDWGVHVALPTELRALFTAAYGEDALSAARRGGGGNTEVMREMARVALGGIDAGERPANLEEGWWDDALCREEVKYMAVDAFLSYKIAENSLEVIGGNRLVALFRATM